MSIRMRSKGSSSAACRTAAGALTVRTLCPALFNTRRRASRTSSWSSLTSTRKVAVPLVIGPGDLMSQTDYRHVRYRLQLIVTRLARRIGLFAGGIAVPGRNQSGIGNGAGGCGGIRIVREKPLDLPCELLPM